MGLFKNLAGGALAGVGSGIATGAGQHMRMEGERLRQAYMERRAKVADEQAAKNYNLNVTRVENQDAQAGARLDQGQEQYEQTRSDRAASNEAKNDTAQRGLDLKETIHSENLAHKQAALEAKKEYQAGNLKLKQVAMDLKKTESKNGENGEKLSQNQFLQLLKKANTTKEMLNVGTEDMPDYKLVDKLDLDKIETGYFNKYGDRLGVGNLTEQPAAAAAETTSAAAETIQPETQPIQPGAETIPAATETPAPAPVTDPAPVTAPAPDAESPAKQQLEFESLRKIAARRGSSLEDLVRMAQEKGIEIVNLPENFNRMSGYSNSLF